jgi:hypothetical protein
LFQEGFQEGRGLSAGADSFALRTLNNRDYGPLFARAARAVGIPDLRPERAVLGDALLQDSETLLDLLHPLDESLDLVRGHWLLTLLVGVGTGGGWTQLSASRKRGEE